MMINDVIKLSLKSLHDELLTGIKIKKKRIWTKNKSFLLLLLFFTKFSFAFERQVGVRQNRNRDAWSRWFRSRREGKKVLSEKRKRNEIKNLKVNEMVMWIGLYFIHSGEVFLLCGWNKREVRKLLERTQSPIRIECNVLLELTAYWHFFS